jgi:predicted nucleotidyltransferase component of viral defense system
MKIPEKYIEEVMGNYKGKPITREMIVKDLALSYILYGIGEDIRKNENSPFKKLIFKGGTLLAKSSLGYHRISEDLDFTFKNNAELNLLSKSGKRKEIKKFIKEEFLPAITKICKDYDFDFNAEEMNDIAQVKYCPVISTIHQTRFNIYINTDESNPIKIEINFCDEPFYKLEKSKIIHLNPSSGHLTYPLKDLKLESYVVEEIVLEKLRAIITRKEGVHERDIYDLFLLSEKGSDPFKIKQKKLKDKIIQGVGYQADKTKEKKHIQELEKRIEELEKNLEADIKNINLTDYDSEKYKKFFKKIKDFVLSIDFEEL